MQTMVDAALAATILLSWAFVCVCGAITTGVAVAYLVLWLVP